MTPPKMSFSPPKLPSTGIFQNGVTYSNKPTPPENGATAAKYSLRCVSSQVVQRPPAEKPAE